MEGLRLFPSVATVPKEVVRPGSITVHTVPAKAGEEARPVELFLAKGTQVRFDVVALCYDRQLSLPHVRLPHDTSSNNR